MLAPSGARVPVTARAPANHASTTRAHTSCGVRRVCPCCAPGGPRPIILYTRTPTNTPIHTYIFHDHYYNNNNIKYYCVTMLVRTRGHCAQPTRILNSVRVWWILNRNGNRLINRRRRGNYTLRIILPTCYNCVRIGERCICFVLVFRISICLAQRVSRRFDLQPRSVDLPCILMYLLRAACRASPVAIRLRDGFVSYMSALGMTTLAVCPKRTLPQLYTNDIILL